MPRGSASSKLELGAISKMFEDKICAVDFCEGAAVVLSLAQQDFCLNHFIDLCYEKSATHRSENPEALDVCRLSCPHCALSSRSVREELWRWRCIAKKSTTCNPTCRLLDILLWAGELFLLLRAPRAVSRIPAGRVLPSPDSPSRAPILTIP